MLVVEAYVLAPRQGAVMTQCAKMRCKGSGPHHLSGALAAATPALCGALLVGGAHENTATLHCMCVLRAPRRVCGHTAHEPSCLL